jgi:hypothetical protein
MSDYEQAVQDFETMRSQFLREPTRGTDDSGDFNVPVPEISIQNETK